MTVSQTWFLSLMRYLPARTSIPYLWRECCKRMSRITLNTRSRNDILCAVTNGFGLDTRSYYNIVPSCLAFWFLRSYVFWLRTQEHLFGQHREAFFVDAWVEATSVSSNDTMPAVTIGCFLRRSWRFFFCLEVNYSTEIRQLVLQSPGITSFVSTRRTCS